MHVHIQVHLVLHDVLGQQSVSSLNAPDRAPIYEMPLTPTEFQFIKFLFTYIYKVQPAKHHSKFWLLWLAICYSVEIIIKYNSFTFKKCTKNCTYEKLNTL